MQLTLKNTLDMHIHLREGEILDSVIHFSAKAFSAALAMPNLSSPIINTQMALDYKNRILNAINNSNDHNTQTNTQNNIESIKDSNQNIASNAKSNKYSFTPIISLYITHNLTKDELIKAKENDIKILKLYPKGSTTGSENGVNEILDKKILDIFSIAEELGFILSIHGESNGFSMDREFEFGEIFEKIAMDFPKLKIIMEHLSDRRSIDLLGKYNNLFATLTLHHITFSLDDVLGSGLNPYYFCKPILKSPKDRDALLELALSANPKVSFGSDSAPHLEINKLKINGSAGIFSAPILLQKLCEIFEKHNRLENLQSFVSDNALNIYDLKDIPNKTITLIKKDSKAPSVVKTNLGDIIPLFAGENLSWDFKY